MATRAVERRLAADAGFEAFFESEYARVVRALFVVTRDRFEAEDVAQEAMARVLERWDRVAKMASPVGYAYTTALNVYRKRRRRLDVLAKHLVSAGQETGLATPERGYELSEALRSLPRGELQALMLLEWFGTTTDEAAALLGIQPTSVRSRVHRARERLRVLLREE